MSAKSIIVGTAGHIDHGKTSLVKALTGIDADRLAEEKRRGITIDLGFAHLELGGYRFGFVDVPGHERFVRNMLAGAGGIDLVLLVVAADEGIKPQTREHFEICRLLGVKSGIVALTKIDAPGARPEAVSENVRRYLRGSFLENAAIVPASSITGAGIAELKQALIATAGATTAKDSTALLRLPIDRVFTMKGFGTVVTGTLVGGSVRKDGEVEVLPSGRRARVRSVQVHGANSEQAIAGERTALNLSGVEKHELARGMTLVQPGVLRTTIRADVELTLLGDSKPLKNHARVHFHAFTAEMLAEVSLFDGQQAAPANSVFAQLTFAEPALLLPGDRFIIRQFSPVITIGGGVVLDNAPARNVEQWKRLARRRGGAPTGASAQGDLAIALSGSRAARLQRLVRRSGTAGITLKDLVAQSGIAPAAIRALERSAEMQKLGGRFFATDQLGAAREKIFASLRRFHEANPLHPGISKEELRGDVPPTLFAAVLNELMASKQTEVHQDIVRLAGRGVVMKDEEAQAKATIEGAFRNAGLRVPALKEVVASLPLDRARATKLVTLLLRERVLVKLGDDLVFHREALEGLRRRMTDYKRSSPRIDVAAFKDLAGVSRKYAIPLLEYLDRERVTRREGETRVIL